MKATFVFLLMSCSLASATTRAEDHFFIVDQRESDEPRNLTEPAKRQLPMPSIEKRTVGSAPSPAEQAQFDKWVQDLDAESFKVREAAMNGFTRYIQTLESIAAETNGVTDRLNDLRRRLGEHNQRQISAEQKSSLRQLLRLVEKALTPPVPKLEPTPHGIAY